MGKKIKEFFGFNKQKLIISLLYLFFISFIGRFIFQYNNSGIVNNGLFNLIYPVEFLYRVIFFPFLDLNKINTNGTIYKLILVICSTSFILSLKIIYYYSIGCFLFWFKNKFIKENKV